MNEIKSFYVFQIILSRCGYQQFNVSNTSHCWQARKRNTGVLETAGPTKKARLNRAFFRISTLTTLYVYFFQTGNLPGVQGALRLLSSASSAGMSCFTMRSRAFRTGGNSSSRMSYTCCCVVVNPLVEPAVA